MSDIRSIEIRQSVGQMVAAYLEANEEIRQAYALLETAQTRLDVAFGDQYGRFQVLPHQYNRDIKFEPPKDAPEVLRTCLKVRAAIKVDAWSNIMNRLEVRAVMSTARVNELNLQLNAPDKLPDITEASVFGLVDTMVNSIGGYMSEAVKEVFEFLRPPCSKYKTNSEFEVGERVILKAFYGDRWNDRPKVEYSRNQDFHNLDNVMHLLDGKGPVKSHTGPLVDGIDKTERFGLVGSTDYFEFKPCKNGNVHIKFLRMDLVAKLNQIAGGNRLRK